MINYILLTIMFLTLIISIIFIFVDSKKKRKLKEYFISFIIPTYNDGEYIEDTIKSIYDSYDKNKFEIFVINDNSKDNTLETLNNIKEKYNLNIINNITNKGKSNSINEAFDKTKGEIVFIVDSDTIINKDAINDILKRLNNKEVGGVSARYKVSNRKGFLPIMQDIEYCMLAFINSSYNIFSTISMWGGCMAFKRKAFQDIGKLSPNFITEDMEASLKLKENGWKCEQSNHYVTTQVPTKFNEFYKQKIRWSSGFIQCFITHYKIYLRNPITIFFMLSYSIFAFCFILSLLNRFEFMNSLYDLFINLKDLGYSLFSRLWFMVLIYSSNIIKWIFIVLIYPLLSLPYLLYDKFYRKKILSWLLVFPYSLVYYPLFMVITTIGMIKGIKRYSKLMKGERAW